MVAKLCLVNKSALSTTQALYTDGRLEFSASLGKGKNRKRRERVQQRVSACLKPQQTHCKNTASHSIPVE